MSVLKQVTDILKSRNLDTFEKINQIPSFDTLLGVDKASEIIKNAILNDKKIAVVGDYDVDGISSTCIMYFFFKDLGYKNIDFKIPNRFIDGYGININIIKELDIPSVIIADAGLGTINSTVLTIEYMMKRKLKINGVILNKFEISNVMHEDNKQMIEEMTDIKVVGIVNTENILKIDNLISLFE